MVSKKEERKLKKQKEKEEKQAREPSPPAAEGEAERREGEGEGGGEGGGEEKRDDIALSTPSRFHQDIERRQQEVCLEGVTIEYKGQTLLENASLFLKNGAHYALVGKNGVGKTTLLRYMEAKNIQSFPQAMKVFHVAQEIIGDETPVLEAVLQADPALAQTHKEIARLEALLAEGEKGEKGEKGDEKSGEELHAHSARLAELYAELESLSGFDAEDRAKRVLQGLKFSPEKIAARTKELSGGWKMRLAIAQALFVEPDILLLDEPTNHLDLPARLWLQEVIASLPQTLVVVSHDRAFLNAVANEVILFKDKQLYYFTGNYDTFANTLKEKAQKRQNLVDWQERQLAHMEESIRKARESGKASGDDKKLFFAASKERAIERFGAYRHDDGTRWKYCFNGYRQKVQPLKLDPPFDFKFEDPEPLNNSQPLIQLREVWFGYNPKTKPVIPESLKKEAAAPPARGKKAQPPPPPITSASLAPAKGQPDDGYIFRHLNMSFDQGSRIGIIGANGTGKSTLLNLLVGNIQPTAGSIQRHHNLRIGYYTQHHVDSLDLEATAIEDFQEKHGNMKPGDIRQYLGGFGIKADVPLQPLKTLSGGQKARVVLAHLIMRKPNLLILDEPTNHLDIDTIESLSRALLKFKGAVILVSHDEALVTSVCKQVYALRKGSLDFLEGGFQEYKASLINKRKAKS